jgi:hypothetical protein
MVRELLTITLVMSAIFANPQKLLLLDRFNGNALVNDSTLMVYSTDPEIIDLTIYFTMKNNTDRPLALFLRKQINYIADSTTDYFCFGISCWPYTDTTNIADTIQPGAEDFTFASHVVHYRRFEVPPLPAGKTSITYTVYDTTAADPVEESVTVIYHLSGVGFGQSKVTDVPVYPNPAASFIRIPLHDNHDGLYHLRIYDTKGHLVKQGQVQRVNDYAELPVFDLNEGYYLGSLTTAGGVVRFKFGVVRN